MKKKFLCAVLAVSLSLSSLIASAATVTMYAQDGRTTQVDTSKVAAYKKVGWYEGVTMYAADGRTTTVSPFKVADYKKVGWHDKKSAVYTLLYTADGRVKYVPKGKVSEYTKIGWSTKPISLTITEKVDNYSYGSGVLYVFGPSRIGYREYANNSNIKILYVADNISSIGTSAFDGCTNLSRVELSDSVTTIEAFAFNETSITRIGIPKSVTTFSSYGYAYEVFGSPVFSTYASNMVIYCEKGSKAEEFAKNNNLKYVYATMIYSPDGRTMMVDNEEKEAYLASGLWADAPAITMYALDGRTKLVKKTDVAAYKKVGWYDKKSDIVTTMYATDGRTKEVLKINVAKEKAVGWFKTKPVKMYAIDGRTKYVEATDVAANKKVGWFKTKPVKMYSIDGRAKYVEATDVATNQKVGWFKTKPVKMYAADGRTKYVEATDVVANKKVGWFKTKPVKMYSIDGRTKYVEATDVVTNQKVGWFKTKPVKMYAADGRTKYVESTDVTANKKVGWYDKKSDVYSLLYSSDGRIMYAPKAKISQYTASGWSTQYTEWTPKTKIGADLFSDGVVQVFKLSDDLISDSIYKNNKNIKTAYICGNIKTIYYNAFYNCVNLSRVEISDTVTEIESAAFTDASIKRIGIPKSVTDFNGGYSFAAYGSIVSSSNKDMIIYCEKGSEAEKFAKSKKLKYVYATMIYCVDGRTMMVDAEEKEAYLASGLWHTTPKIKLYSADGKTKIVDRKDLAANKKVGWFEKSDIFVPMYSADGKTKLVLKKDIAANKKVGWYSLPEYGKFLVNKKGGEAAISFVESQGNAVDTATYNNAVKETLNAYYKKIGCPVAVVKLERDTNIIGIPEIHITFRNVSPKTLVAFDFYFFCYDAYGRITGDWGNNGKVNARSDHNNKASGTTFTQYWTLNLNERTHSISWPVITKAAFSDGTAWYK